MTKASWVAGGYWQKPNQWPSTPFSSPLTSSQTNTPLTRSSSQSSGFGSVLTGIFSNRSPPDSRPESTFDEIDCLSTYSDNFESPRNQDPDRSTLRYDSSPVPYGFHTDLSRASLMSSISSVNNGSAIATNVASPSSISSQWSWLLPFMLGFSLALNVCIITYCVFLHSSKI